MQFKSFLGILDLKAPFTYYPNGMLKSGFLSKPHNLTYSNIEFMVHTKLGFSTTDSYLKKIFNHNLLCTGEVVFNSEVERLILKLNLLKPKSLVIGNKTFHFSNFIFDDDMNIIGGDLQQPYFFKSPYGPLYLSKVIFSSSTENLIHCSLDHSMPIHTKYGDLTVHKLEFYDDTNLQLKQCFFSSNERIKTEFGNLSFTDIILSKTGDIVGGSLETPAKFKTAIGSFDFLQFKFEDDEFIEGIFATPQNLKIKNWTFLVTNIHFQNKEIKKIGLFENIILSLDVGDVLVSKYILFLSDGFLETFVTGVQTINTKFGKLNISDNLKIREDFTLHSVYLQSPQIITIENKQFTVRSFLSFYDSQNLSSFTLHKASFIKTKLGKLKLDGRIMFYYGNKIYFCFFVSGTIQTNIGSIKLSEHRAYFFKTEELLGTFIKHQSVHLTNNQEIKIFGYLYFYKNGIVKTIYTDTKTKLHLPEVKNIMVKKINFTKDAIIKNIILTKPKKIRYNNQVFYFLSLKLDSTQQIIGGELKNPIKLKTPFGEQYIKAFSMNSDQTFHSLVFDSPMSYQFFNNQFDVTKIKFNNNLQTKQFYVLDMYLDETPIHIIEFDETRQYTIFYLKPEETKIAYKLTTSNGKVIKQDEYDYYIFIEGISR